MGRLRNIGRLRAGGSGFSPLSLFAAGEQGGWYDPSDLSSMFSDSAGTTPAVLDGPVGKINDKSGRGNHLIQATAASRPTLSARYNRLTKTELLTDAAWAKTNSTVTAGATDPLGGTTAFTLTATGANGEISNSVTASTGTLNVYLKRRTGTGTVNVWNGSVNVPTAVTASWVLFTVPIVNATVFGCDIALVTNGDAIDVWHPDLRTTADAALAIPVYQRVDTATSYDTSGFPMYLLTDGVDDGIASAATVDLSGTNKLTVFAGLTKSSDAAAAMFLESTADATANNGGFALTAPASAAANYSFIARGSVAAATRTATTYTAPISNVLTCSFDNSAGTTATQVIPRINALTPTLADSAATSAGNFANATLYVGRRGGTTLPFNGRIYQLIIRGATSTAAQIASTETYVGSKMGIAL